MIFLHASKSYPEGRSAIWVISERGWPWLSSDLKKKTPVWSGVPSFLFSLRWLYPDQVM